MVMKAIVLAVVVVAIVAGGILGVKVLRLPHAMQGRQGHARGVFYQSIETQVDGQLKHVIQLARVQLDVGDKIEAAKVEALNGDDSSINLRDFLNLQTGILKYDVRECGPMGTGVFFDDCAIYYRGGRAVGFEIGTGPRGVWAVKYNGLSLYSGMPADRFEEAFASTRGSAIVDAIRVK
jgi:hypothetical protein